jgi:anthranilate phosphoribosyltransferase
MVKGLATEHIQAQKVEPAGKADIPVTRGDGAISFNLSPLSHYEVRY